ncbi:MAG: hypothetical protein R3326_03760 [Gemmatimonadota bacterium]|nr:hypothetical protein [Gemmatimonadota bacterium]
MRALLPLVRFELVRRLRWRPLAGLLIAHPIAVVVAYLLGSGSGPPLGTDVAAIGMQLVWLFLVCFELGRDRELGLDALLVSNLVGPWSYVAAKIVALGGLVIVYHGALLLAVAGLSPTGLIEAKTAAGGTISLLAPLLPLVLLAELFVETRVPLAYVAVVGGGVLLMAFWSGVGAEAIAAWLGLESGDAFSARPVWTGIVGLVVSFPLAVRRASADFPF